jgi:hypothetical protein
MIQLVETLAMSAAVVAVCIAATVDALRAILAERRAGRTPEQPSDRC